MPKKGKKISSDAHLLELLQERDAVLQRTEAEREAVLKRIDKVQADRIYGLLQDIYKLTDPAFDNGATTVFFYFKKGVAIQVDSHDVTVNLPDCNYGITRNREAFSMRLSDVEYGSIIALLERVTKPKKPCT